jgi:hypothetical protein
MQSLEYLYEIKNKNTIYFDRKVSISSKNTIINGVKKSGKTHLVRDFLTHFEQINILYIDLNDERIEKKRVVQNLEKFIQSKPIEILVIENFDFSFALPKVSHIILTCNSNYQPIKGFETITLFPLDFEEFISFDKKHFNIEHLFNLYTTFGTFPSLILENNSESIFKIQEMLRSMFDDKVEFLIFKKFTESQGNKISLFQVYNQLKTSIKISKDNLYNKVKKLEDEKMLFFVEKFLSPKANKKVFLIDFAIKSALTFKKDFLRNFENIVFLELLKRDEKIYYTDLIDLYNDEKNYAIFCIPFLTEDFIEIKLNKILSHLKELHIKKVDIVTIGNEGGFLLENIECTILPFWDWALQY